MIRRRCKLCAGWGEEEEECAVGRPKHLATMCLRESVFFAAAFVSHFVKLFLHYSAGFVLVPCLPVCLKDVAVFS